MHEVHPSPHHRKKTAAMTIAALGVVYGDIGTSPLYAINEIFFGRKSSFSEGDILGCISLVFWTLSLIISVKYLAFVLRADSDGEGGIFALYSKVYPHKTKLVRWLKILMMLAAGLLFGEGVITPAISVLSAVEGLGIITETLSGYTVPITIGILIAVFAIQSKGTHIVGKAFGPIALLWFLTIGALGAHEIFEAPEILKSLNPGYAIQFLIGNDLHRNLIILGSIMLVITGGEALFADMGHFGKGPIRKGWFIVVYPALILSYLGQGAYLLSGEKVLNGNVFFSLVPKWFLPFMVVLATLATIIASQALISGAFSIASQAIRLGLFPRLKIQHTHHEHAGQIYLRFVNWMLFAGTVLLVLTFRSSTALASAYGLSVSGVMFTTSLAMLFISSQEWNWRLHWAWAVFGLFAVIDGTFLISNSLKFLDGGFIPLCLGVLIFSIMRIWRWGRKTTYAAYSAQKTIKLIDLIELKKTATHFIDRNVVFMVPKPIRNIDENTPALVQFFINRYGSLPKHLFLVEVIHLKIPFVHGNRCESTVFYKDETRGSVTSVTIEFGFMEEPNVEKVLESLAIHHQIALPSDPHRWLVHVSHENLLSQKDLGFLKGMQLKLFLLFRQISQPAYYYYGLGKEVNLTIEVMPVKIS